MLVVWKVAIRHDLRAFFNRPGFAMTLHRMMDFPTIDGASSRFWPDSIFPRVAESKVCSNPNQGRRAEWFPANR